MRIRSVWLTRGVGWLVAMVAKGLFRTCRIHRMSLVEQTDCAGFTSRLFIYSLWHDEIMVPIAARCREPVNDVAALVSRHQDGSYLTEFMRHMRIRAVRGSKNHGGHQALRELMDVASCCHLFITPDGPRGPKHELKVGVIYLASTTGLPIVPVSSCVDRHWKIKGNWTDLIIPKPFSNCYYLGGEPITVPPNLDREQLEEWRQTVQAAMQETKRQLQARITPPRDQSSEPPSQMDSNPAPGNLPQRTAA